jgi:hypothetical protein
MNVAGTRRRTSAACAQVVMGTGTGVGTLSMNLIGVRPSFACYYYFITLQSLCQYPLEPFWNYSGRYAIIGYAEESRGRW